MSSALNLQDQSFHFNGQISGPSSLSTDFRSGFSQSAHHRRIAMNPSNAGEDWSSGNKSGLNFRSEAPRSGSGLARPRLLKIRKGQSSKPSEIPSTVPIGPGFNPFRPEPDSSGLGSSGPSESFVFGASGASDSEKNVVEELKGLRIGGVSSKGESFAVSKLKEEMKKLDIDSLGKDKLQEDMRKLIIEDPGNDKAKSGKSDLSGNESVRLWRVSGGDNVAGSVGKKEIDSELLNELNRKWSIKTTGDSLSGGSGATLRDQLKSLNIEDPLSNDDKENSESLGGRKEASSTAFAKDEATGDFGSKLSPNLDNVSVHKQFVSDAGIANKNENNSHVDAKISVSDLKDPTLDKHETRDESVYMSQQDYQRTPSFEFRTAAPKATNLFSGANETVQFSAMRDSIRDPPGRRKKGGKLRGPTKVQLWLKQDFVAGESSALESPEASDIYSPMEVSPYRETLAENRCSRENSVTSDGSFSLDNDPSTDSVPKASTIAVDEDLAMATEPMDINYEVEETHEETKEEHLENNNASAEGTLDESVSGAETESFKSATEEVAFIETEVASSSNVETHDTESRASFGFSSSSEDRRGQHFTFSASTAAQSQYLATKRLQKKKNLLKFGHESSCTSPNAKVSYASPSSQFIPFSGTSLISSPGKGPKVDPSSLLRKTTDGSDVSKTQAVNLESGPTSASNSAAQEACEKWRLRGNQAYKSGELSKAEDSYTQGIGCISKGETSRSCLRALMLCYSNRAATRISLGRMRDALEDCTMAADIDPSFLRVQVRAANCYLALGEVENAVLHFKRCLQAGSDCVDRKIAVEASDGLQKLQKISECMSRSSELLLKKTSNDAGSALEIIAEALTISPYSEKLLEMKAEALFLMRRYEEAVELCEQTLGSSEMNSPPIDAHHQSGSIDAAKLSKYFYFRVWRCRVLLKSYFQLGRLEDGLASLEKQEEKLAAAYRNESKVLESALPLAATIRELLRHKAAGNEAFQAGKHTEAVERYTAALSCNVESRPFAAVCFCNRAAAFKALGQITDAIADCSLAMALDKNYTKAISRRATLYEMIRDYGQAARDLERLAARITKQLEEKSNPSGASDRSHSITNDLRQARLRLSEIEEESRKDIPLDMYLILGVDPSVSTLEIKKAYRKAALRHHPDKACQFLARSDNSDDGLWKEISEEVYKDADRLFKMIGEAYAVLSDPNKRSRYDTEEEMRNAQKKRNGSSTSRAQTNNQNYRFERGSGRRQWKDVWRSHGNSTTTWSETPWSNRYT